jgi:hypothetical protein
MRAGGTPLENLIVSAPLTSAPLLETESPWIFEDFEGDTRESTIHAVLDRHGLVKRAGGPRHRARGTPLTYEALQRLFRFLDRLGIFAEAIVSNSRFV